MGFAGRKRRLRNFDERAKSFMGALGKKESGASKNVWRDMRILTVGAGRHKRLALKARPKHAKMADKLTRVLLADFQINRITPKAFVLAEPWVSEHGVQEYFNKPSLQSLAIYLSRPGSTPLEDFKRVQPHDYALCKQFANHKQNKAIARADLLDAFDEFNARLDGIHKGMGTILSSNLIVLGRTKEGKLRLALIDV